MTDIIPYVENQLLESEVDRNGLDEEWKDKGTELNFTNYTV